MTDIDESLRARRNRPDLQARGTAPPTSSPTPCRAVAIVMVGMFMAILDSFIVIVAEPAIKADLGASSGQLQWIMAGYAQQVGGALGVAIIGLVFFSSFRPATEGKTGAAAHALAMSSIFTLITAIVATLLVYLLPTGRARSGGRP
ncbi:hypothetical protein [Microtetraspora malaysiensis]|uniref:hypothetical protein n=1 Tax=Microtetraspora malaysiensis TaxID=161358 RepID=UPI003D8E2956